MKTFNSCFLIFFILLFFPLEFYSQEKELEVENHFGIYLLNTAKRHKNEKVLESDGRIMIRYWFDKKNVTKEQIICSAYQWLLLGRGKIGKGAKEAFEKIPWLKNVTLNFYKVEFSSFSDSIKGEISYQDTESNLLKIKITKQTASAYDPEQVKKDLSDEVNCVSKGEKYVSDYKYYF